MPLPGKGERQPGSGRQKGTTNGDTAKLRGIILAALDQVGGQEYLAKVALDEPVAFLSLIGKVLPREMNVGGQEENPIRSINKIELVPLLGNDSQNSAA